MSRLIAFLTALAFIFSAEVAHADGVSGKVAEIDFPTIVLEDGTIFTIGEGVRTDGLEPGIVVILTYEERNGQKFATNVVLVN